MIPEYINLHLSTFQAWLINIDLLLIYLIMDIFENISVFEIALGFNPKPQIHTHSNHEFFLCADGSGTQHLKNKTVKMVKDDFFFFPEGQQHIGIGAQNGGCTGLVLNIKESLLLKLAENGYEFGKLISVLKENSKSGKNKINLADRGKSEIKKIYHELINENKNRRTGYNLAARSLLQRFLIVIAREAKFKYDKNLKSRASSEDKIKEICRFIESNYMYRINVEQIAKLADLSRSHFHALFYRTAGKPLIKYLNEIRVRKAVELLKKSEMELEDISSSCGFTSLSHFYLVFRKETGKCPSDFRHYEKK
jgi:AraC-like DNA-binding protein